MELQKTRTGKEILKKNEVGGLTFTDFMTNYKSKVITPVQYWNKDRSMEQN